MNIRHDGKFFKSLTFARHWLAPWYIDEETKHKFVDEFPTNTCALVRHTMIVFLLAFLRTAFLGITIATLIIVLFTNGNLITALTAVGAGVLIVGVISGLTYCAYKITGYWTSQKAAIASTDQNFADLMGYRSRWIQQNSTGVTPGVMVKLYHGIKMKTCARVNVTSKETSGD